ncbi:MAG: hypothetical protein WBW02_20790, partial [Candidatus Sulfotelmatobacter sp.]
MGLPAFFLCLVTAFCFGQSQTPVAAPSAASGPKADAIYLHGNIYTGVPSNTQFSSILRAEAIAVRGDRILAVGK